MKIRNRVLVVDDDPSQRTLIKRILELHGLEVWLAESGQIALDSIKSPEQIPDLILLDMQMPGLDGYETLLAVRTVLGDATPPVIGLSGSSERGDEREFGFADYLSKPFGIHELTERLNPFVDMKLS